ncbi:MAG: LysM peptidoglycan-binding domain-containing protein [Phycisphaerae bacterium]|nr:LysM peptidoglycan-binding domain-containing protein [Phycisphaerae bacterium]
MKFHISQLICIMTLLGGCYYDNYSPAPQYQPPSIIRTKQYTLQDAFPLPLESMIVGEDYWKNTRYQAPKTKVSSNLRLLPAHRWGTIVHQVKPGDTLYGLSRKYHGDAKRWSAIAQANGHAVDNNNQLKANCDIYIDAHLVQNPILAQKYVANSGDSLTSIAQKFFNDPQRSQTILNANGEQLTKASDLQAGMVLKLR